MNTKSERGQIAVVALLAIAIVAALLMFAMAANMPNMKDGADAIAETLTDADNQIALQDLGLAVYWKGSQTLSPNKHAIERHGTDAWVATDCYNRNGAFMVFENRNGEFNLLCRDDNGQVRDVMLKRRGNSSVFDFVNAYTPKDGVFARIDHWLRNTWQSRPSSMPSDAVIVIDGMTP